MLETSGSKHATILLTMSIMTKTINNTLEDVMKSTTLFSRFIVIAMLLATCLLMAIPTTKAYAITPTPTLSPTPTPVGQTETEGAVQDALDSLNKQYDEDPFSKVSDSLSKTVASGYKMMRTVGFMVLVLCALLAALLFGVFKNEKLVQEYKSWFIRILAVVAIIALIPTLIGLVASIGK